MYDATNVITVTHADKLGEFNWNIWKRHYKDSLEFAGFEFSPKQLDGEFCRVNRTRIDCYLQKILLDALESGLVVKVWRIARSGEGKYLRVHEWANGFVDEQKQRLVGVGKQE